MVSRDYFLNEYLGTARSSLDADAQPTSAFNAKRRLCRAVNEMLGICKGLLADGELVDCEISFLKEWFQKNQEVVASFPAREIYARIHRIYEDGFVSEDEREDLKHLLASATGVTEKLTMPSVPVGAPVPKSPSPVNCSTTLPFDDPEPEIAFTNQRFSFTGKFVSGTRSWCAEQVIARGGRFDEKPIATTNVLVIGALGSRDWAHTSFGRKIEAALKYKPPLKIVSEQHWAGHLQ
jgi:hypothetical protein